MLFPNVSFLLLFNHLLLYVTLIIVSGFDWLSIIHTFIYYIFLTRQNSVFSLRRKSPSYKTFCILFFNRSINCIVFVVFFYFQLSYWPIYSCRIGFFLSWLLEKTKLFYLKLSSSFLTLLSLRDSCFNDSSERRTWRLTWRNSLTPLWYISLLFFFI